MKNTRYLLSILCMSAFMCADISAAAPAAANQVKDPVVLKMNGKDVKLSEIWPMLVGLVGGNLGALSREQLMQAVDMAKKMYVMQEVLSAEAAKKGYDKDAKYTALFERAKLNTSIDILMRETGKSFSDAELRKAYPKFANSKALTDYKFSVIVVQDENTARSVIAGINSGTKFEEIAKAKSVHRSADRTDKPGLVEFTREDYLVREFGQEIMKSLKTMGSGDLTKSPIKTFDGRFAIIKFNSKRKSAPLSFDELKPMLMMNLTNEKFAKMVETFIKSGKVKFFALDGKEEPISNVMPSKG